MSHGESSCGNVFLRCRKDYFYGHGILPLWFEKWWHNVTCIYTGSRSDRIFGNIWYCIKLFWGSFSFPFIFVQNCFQMQWIWSVFLFLFMFLFFSYFTKFIQYFPFWWMKQWSIILLFYFLFIVFFSSLLQVGMKDLGLVRLTFSFTWVNKQM